MSNPTHDPGADGVEPDPGSGERPLHPAHPAAEAPDVLLGNQPMRRENPEAEEANPQVARKDHALVLVDLKT